MNAEKMDSSDGHYSISKQEWDNRVLCGDESCIGVIGPDGRCKECGKPFAGQPPRKADTAAEDTNEPPRETQSPSPSAAADKTPPDDAVDADVFSDDWENRLLCSDGNCIGVIGADGRCKECGKPHDGS